MFETDFSAVFDAVDHRALLKGLDRSLSFGALLMSGLQFTCKIDANTCMQVSSNCAKLWYFCLFSFLCNHKTGTPVIITVILRTLECINKPLQQIYEKLIDEVITCINDVSDWMIANKFKLNDDKTESLIIGSKIKVTNIQCLR